MDKPMNYQIRLVLDPNYYNNDEFWKLAGDGEGTIGSLVADIISKESEMNVYEYKKVGEVVYKYLKTETLLKLLEKYLHDDMTETIAGIINKCKIKDIPDVLFITSKINKKKQIKEEQIVSVPSNNCNLL